MPAPKPPEYPKAMWRGDAVAPVYAIGPKHEDKLAEQGYSEHYSYRQYPKMVYWPNERKWKGVEDKAEENQAVAEGWILDPQPCHYGEVDNTPNMPMPTEAPAGSLAAEMAEMRSMMREQQKLINSLLLERAGLASEEEAPPKKRGKKDDAA